MTDNFETLEEKIMHDFGPNFAAAAVIVIKIMITTVL